MMQFPIFFHCEMKKSCYKDKYLKKRNGLDIGTNVNEYSAEFIKKFSTNKNFVLLNQKFRQGRGLNSLPEKS